MKAVGKKDADELDDTGEIKIGFQGNGSVGFSAVENEGVFKQIDSPLDGYAVSVQVVPVLCISRDAGIQSEILSGTCIDTFAVGRGRAGMFAGAYPFGADLHGFIADPLETRGTVLAAGPAEVFEGCAVHGAKGRAERVEFNARRS